MNLLEVIIRFITVGFLTIGGGLVSIPLLYDVFVDSSLLTSSFFYQLVSIAESTPGPIAINLATYLGFTQAGIIGSAFATIAFVSPSFLILTTLYPVYLKYRHTPLLSQVMQGIKLTVLGLIAVTLYRVVGHLYTDTKDAIFVPVLGWIGLGLFFYFNQKRPVLLIGCGALFGFIFLR